MNIHPKSKIEHGELRIIQEARRQWRGFEIVSAVEDTSNPVRTRYKNDHHLISVLLGGRYKSFEITVDSGPPKMLSPVEGDVFIIPANREVVRHVHGGRVEYAMLRFPADAVAGVLGVDKPPPDIGLNLGIRDEFIYRSVRKLLSLLGAKDPLSETFGASLLATLCIYLFVNYDRTRLPPLADRSPLSAMTRERLRQYLEANLDARITLPKMAEVARMSQRQFLQAFHRAYGMTPTQHLISLRINRACELLLTNSVNILDIAMLTGFSSHAHLTRTFKERIGMNPRDYRRRAGS